MKQILVISLLLSMAACQGVKEKLDERKSEGSARKAQMITNLVTADVQTEAVPQDPNEDAADDPAVWIDPDNAVNSVVYGTDKKGGLAAYNLKGEELAYYPIGNINNVDIRQNVLLGGDTVDVIACTNRSNHSVTIGQVFPEGKVRFYEKSHLKSCVKDEVYGFALYLSTKTGKLYAFLNSKAGEMEQWELQASEELGVKGTLVRSFEVGTQTEGMVADDERGILYLGMEDKGICRIKAEPENPYHKDLILRSRPSRNRYIEDDIEGLALYKRSNCECYLIASSQGNNSYAVFDLSHENRYLYSFRITDNKGSGDAFIDGAEETDGIEVISVPLGDQYPLGMLVVQDGYNRDENGVLLAQNFKYIDWQKIERLN